MKVLTPGHKYELSNFEPASPLDGSRMSGPLAQEAYRLCGLIEAIPAGPEATAASVAAGELLTKLNLQANGPQVIQFIEKGPTLIPGELKTINNGTTNEEVLKMLIDRMQSLYNKFPSEETWCSIGHLKTALYAQQSRTYERQQRGVEGKHLK